VRPIFWAASVRGGVDAESEEAAKCSACAWGFVGETLPDTFGGEIEFRVFLGSMGFIETVKGERVKLK
jgi:hypothetical protein